MEILTTENNNNPWPCKADLNHIPSELKKLDQWVVWKHEDRAGKATKVPFNVRGGKAKVNNRQTWGTFEQAEICLNSGRFEGIGFVITEDDPYLCIDFDKYDAWPEEVDRIVKAFDSFTELSPSGNGVHTWIKAKKPESMGCKSKNFHSSRVEIYDRERFITFTGMGHDYPIFERQEELEREFAPLIVQDNAPTPADQVITTSDFSATCIGDVVTSLELCGRHDSINLLTNGHQNDKSAEDLSVCNDLAFVTKDAALIDSVIRASAMMRPKWDRVHSNDGSTYGQMTINSALKTTLGQFDDYSEESGIRFINDEVEPGKKDTGSQTVEVIQNPILSNPASFEDWEEFERNSSAIEVENERQSRANYINELVSMDTGTIINPMHRPLYASAFPPIRDEEIETAELDTNFVRLDGSIIGNMARNMADVIKGIDPNAAWLMGIACVGAAAKAANFKIQSYGSGIMNLNCYAVAAAPPGTGKTAVVNTFYSPLISASEEVNENNRYNYEVALKRYEAASDKLESAKNDENSEEYKKAQEEIKAAGREMAIHGPIPTRALSDSTPQAAAAYGKKHAGQIHLVDSEGEVLARLFGAMSESTGSIDYQLILKGFNGDKFSSDTIGRGQVSFDAYVTLAAFAQPSIFNLLAEAGRNGRGVIERPWLYNSKTVPVDETYGMLSGSLDSNLLDYYGNMIKKIVTSQGGLLTISGDVRKALLQVKNRYWERVKPGGDLEGIKYYIDKTDQRVLKLAGVIHIISACKALTVQEMNDNSVALNLCSEGLRVSLEAAELAIQIDEKLIHSFCKINNDYAASELDATISKVLRFFSKRTAKTPASYRLTRKQIKDNFKTTKLSPELIDKALDILADRNQVLVRKIGRGRTYFINPAI